MHERTRRIRVSARCGFICIERQSQTLCKRTFITIVKKQRQTVFLSLLLSRFAMLKVIERNIKRWSNAYGYVCTFICTFLMAAKCFLSDFMKWMTQRDFKMKSLAMCHTEGGHRLWGVSIGVSWLFSAICLHRHTDFYRDKARKSTWTRREENTNFLPGEYHYNHRDICHFCTRQTLKSIGNYFFKLHAPETNIED